MSTTQSSAPISHAPPAAKDDDEPTAEEMANAKRVMKVGLILAVLGALGGGFVGYTAPASAKAKLATWHHVPALITNIEVSGSLRKRKTYLDLAYSIEGKTVETSVDVGRSTDHKVGEIVAILVSPKNLEETEWQSSMESMPGCSAAERSASSRSQSRRAS